VLIGLNLTLRGSTSGILEERVRLSFDYGANRQVTIGIERVEFKGKDMWHEFEYQMLGAYVWSLHVRVRSMHNDPNQRANGSILLGAYK
jgi:hypothetical protein